MKNAILVQANISANQTEIIKYIVKQIVKFTEAEVIDFYKGNKLRNLLGGVETIKYIFDQNNWCDEAENIDRFLDGKNYDNIFVVRTSIFKYFKCDKVDMAVKFLEDYELRPDYGRTFLTMKLTYDRILFLKRAADKDVNIIQIIIDPQEPVIRQWSFGKGRELYILNSGKLKYAPLYEYMMFESLKYMDKKKRQKFTFYCIALTEDRLQYIVDYKEYLERNYDCKIIIKKDGKPIKQQEYYNKLSKSKYTLIMPSYDISTFSIIRFLEAIMVDCLPLVYSLCGLADLKRTFPDIFAIVERKLILEDIRGLDDKMAELDDERISILDEIKATKSFKKITTEEMVSKYYTKLLKA